ncbi:ankyrin repeat domain-containing protein [Wolbachia endosymbiont (group A) of Andrena hattorfiana]|uniref:ankyrin repeat domain-containing protein n=1 Tax=Wolbachia endosymbiont (group A) of Andrena hattorfiana TaxID=2953977 RepID=UPI0021F841E9|nr:ankyrin repeat domain-containing protein [Wolbachia endosymbiont (group A) of Andrena hattorfiana]
MFKIQYPTDHLKKEDVNSKITELSDEMQYIEQAREFSQLKRYRRSDVDSESGSRIKRIDVPGDGSCLFWSVTMAYLIPVRNDDALFRQRYEVLFGNEGAVIQNLDRIRNLVRNLSTANYDDTFANLVRNVFRNRVVDHISSHESEFRNFVEGESGLSFKDYLENMRKLNTWGGEPEIRAMSGMLSATISVSGEVPLPPYGNGDIQIQLFHVGAPGNRNHYNFGLESNIINNDKELAKGLKKVMGKVRPQDFELIQLLIEEAGKEVGTNQQEEDFKSFETRFQSFVDQVPSYLHSVGKAGFFTHFFLGSFSTLLDTEIAEKLNIKKIYFSFDTSKTLKVAIVKNGQIGNAEDAINNIDLFSISEGKRGHQFTVNELENILRNNIDRGRIRNRNVENEIINIKNEIQDRIKSRLVQIYKGKDGIFVDMETKGILDSATSKEFHEIEKGAWNNPEADIAELSSSRKIGVKESLERILRKISKVHSKYENSLIYDKSAREAAHHGFMVGVFMNFHYRYNLRVYPEQFAGRGYADIILLARGPDRALDSIPIIIELKAGAGTNATPDKALQQAEKYAQGFQPNVQRVLTTADNILCVGVNLDNPSPISDIKVSNRGEEIIPLFQDMLKSADDWDTQRIGTIELKGQVKDNLERIYHTFPGTSEKGDNHYFSRFLLGQSLLLNRIEDLKTGFKKYIFIYGNNIPTEVHPNLRGLGRTAAARARERLSANLDASHAVVTMVLIPENTEKLVYVINIVEANRKDVLNGMNEVLPLDRLNREIENREIVELNLNFDTRYKSDFKRYLTIWTEKYNSLQEYNNGDNRFQGTFKEVTYPNELKETFDKALDIQSLSIRGYSRLLEKIGEGIFPFKSLVNKEAHFHGILNGVFSYYSDLKLQESPETRALVLTEFQTGRGERIDMLVHGIKFVAQGGNAEEYTPIGLELKASRQGKGAQALLREANDQINEEYKEGVTYKTLTDGDEVKFIGVVFDKGSNNPNKLILTSRTAEEGFIPVGVVHSSHHMLPTVGQCSKRKSSSPEYSPSKKPRRERSVSMACIDSFDEEKITEEEKERLIKELFGIEAHDTKIITIDSPQVRIDGGKVNVKFKDNSGNDKELMIDDAANIKSIENYILDEKNLEIKLKVSSDKEYAIIEEIKEQGSEYYLKIDDYRIKLDSIFQDGKEVIFDKLHQLSNDKQLLENKKYIEDIGDVQTNQDYNDIVKEIKQNLLAKGVREDTFDRFKSHFDDLGEKVFADYISNVESSLKEKGIAFDRNKFDSAKIKGVKGGKFFSLMAIYDLLDSIGDTATLGRHDNDALKQVFDINGILDTMDDVRTSVNISPSSKVGKLIGKIPGPARQAFVKVISNPVVQSITFATIAYQFGYSINEIAQGNNHPLNYYWTTSSGVKLASMSIRPISAGVSFTIKSVSATTKILRGLSAAGKVLGRAAVVTMVADVLITMGVKIHERMEYTKAIAEQVPLLPGGEQAEVFFAGVIKFFTGRDVEKEYEDTIRIKGYLTYVKEAAIKLLNDNYDIDAVVQYVISIEEKHSEVIKNMGAQPICIMPSSYGSGCATQMKWTCDLEEKYKDISFDKINIASSVKRDLSSIDISKILTMTPYTLVMSEGWERFICGIKNSPQCYQEIEEKKVYIVNTGAKHIPHLTKYEYENLGLRVVDAPLTNPIQKSQCSKIINTKHTGDDAFAPCNSGKIYRNCQESFTLSGEPFIFTNPKRKDPGNTKKQTFPRGSILYISGPKTLTAAANYPAVMHIPEGSNIRYIGSKNNETIFIINNSMSGTLKGGAGKENTLVMNVKANNVVVDLHEGVIHYGSNNIKLVNTYNYVSNSDSKQNITTHCKTRLINVKNTEVHQGSFDCQDQDYEVRVVNKENVHYRGLKQTIFIVNDNSDNAKIVSDLSDTGKENFDVIDVQGANITQLEISEDIGKGGYSLNLLADDMESIVSSTKIDDFKNLVIQAKYQGITESVVIQDKSLSDIVKDIWYQELNGLGKDIHTLEYDPLSSPIRLNLKIKNRAVLHQSIPYDIIDFAELNVMDINSINIREGERNYINECYNKPISDLTEDSLEIQNITILDSKGIRWSLSIGLIDYLKSPEHQYIILRINNKFYKIDSANLELKHIETNPNFFRYYKPDEQGLQIYHNQPINNNDIGLVDFRDKSILGFDAEVINDSLVLLHKNNTLIKVENWNTYQPAREMIFAFNDTILSNSKCIISTCNSEDIIGDLNKEKVVVLKNQMFNAIVQNNISEAEDLIRRIGNIDTENKHELTPLYVAIQEGRLDVVKLLFNRGSVNVKDKDIHGCNSLHWAAQEGKLNIAKLLVDKGANIIAEDNNGRTPLRVAACNGNLDMVKFFLNKSVDIESESNDPDKMMGKIESIRKEIINQVDASSNVKKWAKSFIEELRYSIKSKAKRKLDGNISSNCSASTTELTNRIYNFDKNLFDNIIKEVVDDAYGRVDTKKILSCVRSHGYIGQLISGYIAVFDAMQKSGDLNDNAIFKLASYIKEAMEMKYYPKVPLETRSSLEKLENRLPKSVRNAIFASKVCIKNVYQDEYLYAANKCFNYDNDRRMAFTWTPKNEENDKFRWKIKPDGNNFYIVNVAFNETLYAASNYFNYDNDRRMVFTWISGGRVARDVWMIKPDGNNCSIMNVKLKEHLYAADYAKYDNDRRRVFTWIPGGQVLQGMWIIEDCGSTVRKVRDIVSNAREELDQELLDAAKVGDMSKVKDSVNRGADVNTKDRDGNTPSRNAVLKGHFGIFKYLVENGVSLEGKDHRCGPSICDASYSGNLDILKYLIGKGVDVNESDKNGWTPLHFAAWRGYLEVANFLIEKGANINVENIFGRKPIHVAAENNNKDIIEFFLSKGMSIDDTDRDGRTPLYYASWNGHLDMVKYLIDKGADIYIQDKGGITPLDAATDQKHDDVERYLKQVQLDKELLIAAQYGNLDEIRSLVGQGASLGAKYIDGRTLMHCAAYGGKLDVVEYLVAGEKSSLEVKDNSGRVSLHYAAYNGKLDVVKYFIDEKKIDVNIKDNNGWASLHWASWGGHLDVVKYLIDKKANINAKDKNSKIPLDVATGQKHDDVVEYLQQTQLSLNKQLIAAVQGGDLSKVKNLVSQGTSLDTKYNDGWTLMHYAAYEGRLDIVKYLVDKWAILEIKYNDGRTFSCNTSLDSASDLVNSYFDTMKCLIGKENSLEVKDNSGKTPLHCAASNGKLDIVKYFVDEEKIDASIKDNSGWTPLHWASWNGHLDVAKYLIGRGANLVNIKDKDGKTPLDIADQKGYTDIVEILKQAQSGLYKKYNELLIAVLENNLIKVKNLVSQGTSLETKDSYGWTLLHFASIYNYSDMAEYLINKGVDINARDQYGKTPLHLTSWFNRLDAMKCLISNNADINAKDNNGKTPLDGSGFNSDAKRVLMQAHLDKELLTTVEGNYLEKIKGLIAQDVSKDRHGAYYYAWSGNLNMVKFLVERDVDVNATDKYGCTLLHWATLKGHLDVAKFLTSKGANVNAEDILGRKPIHFAVINDHRNIIEFLLDKGIIVNSADKQGHTPLHWASWSGHLDMVKYLIDKGANINAKCEADRTPLDIARGRGHSNIVKYLEEKLNQEREKPVQRRRRHHHGDHNRHQNHLSRKTLAIDSSNQHEIAASSGTRPYSWINNCISWAKKLAASTFSIIPGLPTQYNIADKNDDINVKSDNNNIPQSISSVGWNNFLNNENIALASCVADALDDTPGRRYQNLISKGVEVIPSREVAVEFALRKFDSFVEGKIRNLGSKEQARIRVEIKDAYPEITASLERGVEFSGNVGLNNVLEKCKKCFCTNVLPKDKVSTCLSDVGVTKLGNTLSK